MAILCSLFVDVPLEDYCMDDKVQMMQWCAVNCASEWSAWTPCNATYVQICSFGQGHTVRTRQSANTEVCSMFPEFICSLNLIETRTCESGCPFGGIAAAGTCESCPAGRQGSCCEIGECTAFFFKQ